MRERERERGGGGEGESEGEGGGERETKTNPGFSSRQIPVTYSRIWSSLSTVS